ncbi:MAG: amino acid ABC transporter permease, partial [Burkholderiales bacterium]|nr:amino acid ABC transporter permease [Burkholderiales bacterium]
MQPVAVSPLAWVRANLFSSWGNALTTLIILYLLWLAVPPLFNWAFLDAIWGGGDPQACRAA